MNEWFEFGWKALDLADHYQTPIFVLSDLDLGMNQWITPKVAYPDRPIDRGKILWEEDLDRFGGQWGRYKDIDGDGIPYRTVMGNQNPAAAYFTRGTGHNEYGNYSEDQINWANMIRRIKKKLMNMCEVLPEPILRTKPGAKIGIIGWGSTDPALIEAQDMLEEAGVPVDYLRIRALPSCKAVRDFIASHDHTYVLELNRDGQMCSILKLEVSECSEKLSSITDIGGLPMTALWATEQVLAKEMERHG